jgi:hypothetical protein
VDARAPVRDDVKDRRFESELAEVVVKPDAVDDDSAAHTAADAGAYRSSLVEQPRTLAVLPCMFIEINQEPLESGLVAFDESRRAHEVDLTAIVASITTTLSSTDCAAASEWNASYGSPRASAIIRRTPLS